jgi:hypothetical protein
MYQVVIPLPAHINEKSNLQGVQLALRSIQASIKWETGVLSSGVKRQKFDSLLLPPSVDVKDIWMYMTPPITTPNILNFDTNTDILTLWRRNFLLNFSLPVYKM